MDDSQLLKAFVESRDPAAFRQIVDRYADLVYAAARRQVGSGHLTDDVAQAVFMVLSQRAHTVRGGAALAGWLVNATRLAALSAGRHERRLKTRENKVAAMTPTQTQTSDDDEFRSIAPLLDDALARLGEIDRTAITLRYLKQMTVPQVAATMEISEAAASKRITRAVAKLRSHFSRHGVDIPAASIGAAILHSGITAAPAGFAERAASAALINHLAPVAAGSQVTHVIVKGVLAAMTIKQAITMASILALILLLGAGIAIGVHLLNGQQHAEALNVDSSRAAQARAGQASAVPKAAIRVGVFLSEFTARTTYEGNPYGYTNQLRILAELRDPGVVCYPVIEPGTEASPALSAILDREFAGKTPISGYDAAALSQMDVLVASQMFSIHDEMISAITDAVSEGTGLLFRQAFGDTIPGYSPQNLRLHGLVQAEFGKDLPWRKPLSCEIVGEHPILGTLAGQNGKTFDTLPIGAFGVLSADATPLIRLRNMNEINPDQRERPPVDWSFFPLYTVRLGRGHIVICNFNVAAPPARELLTATGGQFSVRAVQWLAAQRASAATQPAAAATQPAGF